MAATHSLQLLSASLQNAAKSTPVGLSDTGDMTIELWIRSNGSISRQTLVTYTQTIGVNTSQEHYRLDLETNGSLRWVQRNASNNVETPTSSAGIVINNVWQHIAVVRQTSDSKIYYYVNGELMESTAYTLTPFFSNTATNFKISDSEAYNGLIRNLRIWGDVRTQNEIRDNMNVDTPNNTTDLLDQFILNNNYNSFSGNNTLTASGSPTFSTTYPDAIDLVENQTFTKKHKITVQHTQVAGSANLTDVPIVFTESNFLSEIFTNSQGSEINTNKLKTDSNLKAYYRFESGALTTDSSGNGYTLTNNNTVGETTGKFGGAADFGSSNTNKSLSISNDLGILGTAITLSCWVKLNTEVASGSYHFVSQQNNTTDIWFHLSYEFNSGTRRLAFKRTRNGVANDEFFYTITLGTSNWYHLILTYDSATVRGYLNGVLVGSVASTGNGSGTTLDSFDIGRYNNGSYASALIDDVAVFNRALSAEEVRSLYAGGQDLRFSSDIDGKTRLAHEIVSFDKGTSKAEVWVKANTLDYDDNTDIYVHYGNATASALDENEAFGKHQVYPSAYKAVWHMGNATDSTSASNDGTATSVTFNTTNGKIVDGGGFNGTNSRITHGAIVTPQGAKTVGFWMKKPSNPAATKWIFSNLNNGNTQYGLDIGLTPSGTIAINLAKATVGSSIFNFSTPALTDSTWYFIVLSWDGTTGSNAAKIYVDASNTTNATASQTETTAPSGNLAIGELLNSGNYYSGSLDNVFMTNTALTADYISTIYNNQNSPSTFAIPSSLAGGSFLLNFV